MSKRGKQRGQPQRAPIGPPAAPEPRYAPVPAKEPPTPPAFVRVRNDHPGVFRGRLGADVVAFWPPGVEKSVPFAALADAEAAGLTLL